MSRRQDSIEVHSAVRLTGYFWAENDVFKRKISPFAKLVYFFLKRSADGNGESFPSHHTIAEAASISRSQVIRAISELCSDGILEVTSRASEGRSSLFTVKSAKVWGVSLVEPGVFPQETGVCLPGTPGIPVRDTEGIPKEGILKKEREMSGTPDPASNGHGHQKPEIELLAFLNRKAGKHFQPLEANLKLIRARLREATVDQIRAVIGVRCRKWGSDAKMSEYLRPATLFNATNFAQYLGELPATAFMTDAEVEALDAMS